MTHRWRSTGLTSEVVDPPRIAPHRAASRPVRRCMDCGADSVRLSGRLASNRVRMLLMNGGMVPCPATCEEVAVLMVMSQ